MADFEHIYTCPTFLEREGFVLGGIDASVVWSLIKYASEAIDALTNQWFNPDYQVWELDGRGTRLVTHPSDIPISNVEQVEIVGARTTNRWRPYPGDPPIESTIQAGIAGSDTILGAEEYVTRRRQVERLYAPFPTGVRNIKVTGVLGWIDKAKSVETESAEDFDPDSTSLEVDEITGFAVRDVVEVVGVNDTVRVIVTEVDREASTISFDTPDGLLATIPEGAVVRTFGQVPRSIESLCSYFFGKANRTRLSNAAGEAAVDPGRIRKESTDDYSYELFATASGTSSSLVTGDFQHDLTLQRFSKPGGVRTIGPG